MIEVREDGSHPAQSAVLIRCAESGGARGVVRGVELALQRLSWSFPVYDTQEEALAG